MAIDHARRMYKEAKELNSPIGIALSSRAIGDAYLNANMQQPAIESYKEALELLDKIPGSEILEQEILPKFILTLIQASHMDACMPVTLILHSTFSYVRAMPTITSSPVIPKKEKPNWTKPGKSTNN